METSIYNAFVSAFVTKMINFTRVTQVSPFSACFSSKGIGSTHFRPAMRQIYLALQSMSVYWSIHGENSMVEVSKDVVCLGFANGGMNTRTSIVIQGHQLEYNLLLFDIATSRLGFRSSFLSHQTTCLNFNFTSN
ncbi:hypothetical protein Pint_24896 [Pistacia integerrima]|uniref:Uncharacterized protein n=1 Tax=Pistacia integerrima TaxID=434235 RepID=A0ACC0YF20_9ROSI|nr:hypothetical protein Pint_24896 [Pistacia integerrima]